jgi:hypothetical protein
MKLATILIFCLSFFSQVQAQADTTKLKSGKLSLRLNDFEFVKPYIADREFFEALNDSLTLRLAPPKIYPASGTTVVSIDSVTNGELVRLYEILKRKYNKATETIVNRVEDSIRKINPPNHYVNRQMDIADSIENVETKTNILKEGKRRLKRAVD